MIYSCTIQAQIFHNQQQGKKETVDHFAQEVRKLFNYAGGACDGPEAKRMKRPCGLTGSWPGYDPLGLEKQAGFEGVKGRELRPREAKPINS